MPLLPVGATNLNTMRYWALNTSLLQLNQPEHGVCITFNAIATRTSAEVCGRREARV